MKVCGRAELAFLVLISMEADAVCSGLVLFAQPEMLKGRIRQRNASSIEATNTGRSLAVLISLL